MITLQISTAEGASLGTVNERAVGQLDGPANLVDMVARMLRPRGLQSIAGLDGWSNGYLVIRAIGQSLPGPAEDNRPRKIDGKFNTKRLPTT